MFAATLWKVAKPICSYSLWLLRQKFSGGRPFLSTKIKDLFSHLGWEVSHSFGINQPCKLWNTSLSYGCLQNTKTKKSTEPKEIILGLLTA